MSGNCDFRVVFICLRCLQFKAALVTDGAFGHFDQAAKWPRAHESSGGEGGVRMLTLSAAPALTPSDMFLTVVTHGKETICQNPSNTPL